jgi:hypothetical protein
MGRWLGRRHGACVACSPSSAVAAARTTAPSRRARSSRCTSSRLPVALEFDEKWLTVRAGPITFELVDEKRKGHNIRIQTGDECCFKPGSQDVGGTPTIGWS